MELLVTLASLLSSQLNNLIMSVQFGKDTLFEIEQLITSEDETKKGLDEQIFLNILLIDQ